MRCRPNRLWLSSKIWACSRSRKTKGRIYPYSNKAATVLDMLRLGMKEAGVVEHCDREVRAVAPSFARRLGGCFCRRCR